MQTTKKLIAVLLLVVFASAQTMAAVPSQVNKLFASNEEVNVTTVESVDAFSVDLNAIDAQFDAADDITSDINFNMATPEDVAKVTGEKNALIAVLLCWIVGYLGIHRMYLGTETMTFIGYILTCGGCGIVTTVDFWLLLIGAFKDDISKYVDNSKFFMW